jgi:shikimate dehydrogenase
MWRVGVVGDPIAHSRSPQLHLLGMSLLGLSGTSTRVQVAATDVDSFLEGASRHFDALSVTMPLKGLFAERCEHLDTAAASLGVVNSIRWREGRLEGSATDGPGLLDAMRATWELNPSGMHTVVLGSGGSARAIVDALVRAGTSSISVLGRNEATVAALCERYDVVRGDSAVQRPVDLIINTIPVSSRDVEADVLTGVRTTTYAVDITYEPLESSWLALHRTVGCESMNGLPMLAYQAARQMQWWWGDTVDGAILLEGLQ